MAVTLSNLRISLKLEGKLTNPLDMSTAVDPLSKSYTFSFGDGAGANQADTWFHDTRSLAATTAENLDLAGSLVGPFGATLTAARIKAFLIVHKTAAASAALEVGGVANQFLNWINSAAPGTDLPRTVVRPGGCQLFIAPDATGYPVTAGTGDLLKLNNLAAGSVDFDVFILASLT